MPPESATPLPLPTVFLAAPTWSLNGVNIFSLNLARGLRARGWDARIVLTRAGDGDAKPLPHPDDIPIEALGLGPMAPWRERCEAMRDFLIRRAPCIYLPNYDYEHSVACALLPPEVRVVGIAHSDDPEHYDHVRRLGKYWNAVVGVSGAITREIARREQGLEGRLRAIPYGVPAPAGADARGAEREGPLRILYAGRIVQAQKRVMDLIAIMRRLEEMGVPATLTVAGGGADEVRFRDAAAGLIASGRITMAGVVPNDAAAELMRVNDVFLLVSEFEGLPVSLLEAMARGCVPVVSRIESGIPELVREGENGLAAEVGDAGEFAKALGRLERNRGLLKNLSEGAIATFESGGYRLETMAGRYAELFEEVLREPFERPAGVFPPEGSWPTLWRYYIPPKWRPLGYRVAGAVFGLRERMAKLRDQP